MKKVYFSFLLCFALLSLQAQFSDNTSKNLLVADANAADIQTTNTNNGQTWIAFYSQRGSNYDMRAQLLSLAGYKQFGDSGLLVSNLQSGSATYVFNVCVDNDNNLIIAFQYQKGSATECIMQKVSPSGQLLWGKGVDLGPGLSPYPVTLVTNEIAVAWNNNGKIDYQKVSPSGVAVWSTYKEFTGNSGHSVSRAQLVSSPMSGVFSMVYQDQFSFPFYTNLYEQRFDNNGNAVWASAVKLSTLTTVSYRYYSVINDGDTTYVGYYGNPSGSNRFDAYVQKVFPDGGLPYGIDGSAFASAYTGDNDPSEQTIYIAKDKASYYVWAVCTVTNSLQTTSGVYVQKFEASRGLAQFGNTAKVVLPLSSNLRSIAYSNLSLCGDSPLFLVTDNSNKLGAIKLDESGNFAWNKKITVLGSSSNTKFRYGFTQTYHSEAVAIWQEDKGDGDKPYAQNITCFGTTGLPSRTEPVIAENAISIKNLYPNPVHNMLSATIHTTQKTNVSAFVTDLNGNILQTKTIALLQGDNAISLNVNNLENGSYFIKIIAANVTTSSLFQKQ